MEQLNVLQVMDKVGIRGSPIHGVTRLLLSLLPGFENTLVKQSVCVLRKPDGVDPFSALLTPVTYLNHGRLDPRSIIEIIRIVKRDRINVLHCHGYGAANFGRIAGALCGVPVLIHEHMVDARIPAYQKAADWMLSRFTRRAVAVSRSVSTFLIESRSIPAGRIVIVHNAVPEKDFNVVNEAEKAETAKKYSIPEDRHLVGIVGRLDPIKGQDIFLRAAADISVVRDDIRYLVIGNGDTRIALEELSNDLGLMDKVRFLGHCDDVTSLISLLDILVVSSRSEGFSIAAIEAMAQGKAVVGTDVGGLPEVVDDQRTGFLVPPEDPRKMAEAVLRLLDDAEMRSRFGHEGMEACRRKFHINSAVECLIRLYREISNSEAGYGKYPARNQG